MYFMANGLASGTDNVELFPSAAIAANTNGATIDVRHGVIALTLDVTVVSGTNPTLDIEIFTRKDSNGSWVSLGSFTQSTAANAQREVFGFCDRQIRAVATIGGTDTPTFTFSLAGDCR